MPITDHNLVFSLVVATAMLVGILVWEMARRRHSDRRIESYIQFDALITELWSRFVNVPVERIDSEIAYTLGQLPKYLPNISGVSILECPSDTNALSLTRSNLDLCNGTTRFKADDLEWYTRQGLYNKEVVLMDVSQLPKDADASKSILQDRGIGSSLSVPLEASGSVVGTLAFDSADRGIEWSRPMVARCRMLGQIVAGALLRKRTDHALTVSQRIKDLILSFEGVYLVLLDREGTVVAVRNYCGGASPCPITVGDNYIDAFARAVGPHSQAAFSGRVGVQGVLSGERTQFQMEYPRDYERRQHWLAMTVIPLGDTNRLVAVVHRDVSKEKNSEQAVRELGGKLIRAQEEERSRIARELHDDVSQRLALLTVELRRVQDIAPHSIDAEVSSLCRKVDEITADIHNLSRCLHSTKLQLLGLGSALRGLCTECSRQNNINIECCCAEPPTKVDPEVSLSLFRVAQEALNNVLKHSHARNARVELACNGSDLLLRISDDGLGFNGDSEVTAQSSLGLVSMRERMHVIDGTLTVSSSPVSGTEIEARVPVKKAAQSEGSALGSAA